MIKKIFLAILILIFSLPLFAEEYIIKKGDTLWDISKKFYDDNFKWPLIWKYNVTINNPDLIYPKQKIHIPILDSKFEKLPIDDTFKLTKPSYKKPALDLSDTSLVKVTYSLKNIKLNDFEFISETLPNCQIIAVEEGKYYASTGNIIRIKSNSNYKINDSIIIYRNTGIYDDYGYLLKVVGYGTIKTKEYDGTALVVIDKSFEPISKNFLCDQGKELKVTIPDTFKTIQSKDSGKIIYLTDDIKFAGQGNSAIIYERNNTAKVGDIYDIYKQILEDSYKRTMKVGEAQIIFKNGDFLTVKIIKSNLEIAVGDIAYLTKISIMQNQP
ncbi:LysM peptidoglycan-binding domain-containing protein [Deferribacter autotrophicus]|uniref:LysM peptidoglycan-binding domain-containing protein n=1 Tax=Deferribacter autotrophicus TaxID=500465 RepID=A0A5A8F6G4_9BACT|nr:LysM peptidoglycan-binding domain-containing protein [Deferribacter autotrophicus]KAA0257238.1 LysM peptidoglycan-binding domain-containing protein [Deferribacter autotrophicus]